jgi:UDP-glucose 4-epimerase
MPAFINAALTPGESIQIYGDGNQVMDMIYVADVAQTLVSALEFTIQNGPVDGVQGGPIFEAGSGEDTTVNQIAEAVLDVVEPDWRERELNDEKSYPRIYHTPMRPGEPDHSVVLGNPATIDRLKLEPFVDLNEGIRRSVEYFKNV